MTGALVDAGPLIALFDRSDAAHRHYRALVSKQPAAHQLHTTWPCITEASHLLPVLPRLELLRWIGLGGLQVFPFDAVSLLDMAAWMHAYTEPRRAEMDFADASLYWLAQETGVVRVMTTDVRDFSRYRLPDGRSFEIL
jgi:predicted nucleic acid-binding protein